MTRICDKTGVPFDEAVVQPSRAAGVAHGEKLPLVIWFAGLGQQGFDGLPPDALEPQAPGPFLMLAPRRKKGTSWFITGDRPWAWLDGDYDRQELDRIVAWIGAMSRRSDVDPRMVSLIGFSAGAYAATEILASGRVRIHSLIVGGVHGHGQPDLEGIQGAKRLLQSAAIYEKWKKYLERLGCHQGVHGHIGFCHHPKDTLSPIRYAKAIYDAVNDRQEALGCPGAWLDDEVPLDTVSERGQKRAYNDIKSIFVRREVLEYVAARTCPSNQAKQQAALARPAHTAAPDPMVASRSRSRRRGRTGLGSSALRPWSPTPPARDASREGRAKEKATGACRERGSGASRNSRSPTARRRRTGNMVVAISARTGWYVDGVHFKMSDGTVTSWGTGGGQQEVEHKLVAGEYITGVDQLNHHVGYLGSGLTFHLSSGREIAIGGTCGKKKKRSFESLKAPEGQQIYDLIFKGSELTRVVAMTV